VANERETTLDITIESLNYGMTDRKSYIEIRLSDGEVWRREFDRDDSFHALFTTLDELKARRADMDLDSLRRLGMRWHANG